MGVNSTRYIEIDGLTKDFGELRALNDATFQVKEGETFGLIGPNGAGKTTLVRILSGLLSPTSGTATIGGYDIINEKKDITFFTME